jgi:predicted transcriptional regulator
MTDMRTAKTVSITLPPDLLVKAQTVAEREHRTMSELFREALRRYMTTETQAKLASWNDLHESMRGKAAELGISTEEDVERLSDEYRASRQR